MFEGSWIPGVAFVGGAIKLAGKVLDPPAQLSDLRDQPETQSSRNFETNLKFFRINTTAIFLLFGTI